MAPLGSCSLSRGLFAPRLDAAHIVVRNPSRRIRGPHGMAVLLPRQTTGARMTALCPTCGQAIDDSDDIRVSLETNTFITSWTVGIVPLAPTEAEMLSVLVNHMPMPINTERIIIKLWGYDASLWARCHVGVLAQRLRRKMAGSGFTVKGIKTGGYQLIHDAPVPAPALLAARPERRRA